MLSIKPGVLLKGFQVESLLGLLIVKEVFDKHGVDFVLTSCMEGNHMRGSRHYIGQAFDVRSRNIPKEKASTMFSECAVALGSNFDLVKEGTHWHCEYDPKV